MKFWHSLNFVKHFEVFFWSLLLFLTALTGCPGDGSRIIIRSAVNSSVALSALDVAISKIGVPYVLGGKGPYFLDCSGIISSSYRSVDSTILFNTSAGFSPDVAMQDLYDRNVVHIDQQQVNAGDIVFITSDSNKISHGGLFIKWIQPNEFCYVNASSYYSKVVVDSFTTTGVVRNQWVVGFGRLLK